MGFFENIGATLPTFHFDDIASGKEEVPTDRGFFIKLPNGEKASATAHVIERVLGTYISHCHECVMHELKDRKIMDELGFMMCHVRCDSWSRADQCRIIIKSDDLVKKFNGV